MRKIASYGHELFIAKKENKIRESVAKKQNIQRQIDVLLEEIEFLDQEIEADRYSIRKLKGRG